MTIEDFVYEPGFHGKIIPYDIQGFETVLFAVVKTTGSEPYDDFKDGKASVMIVKRVGNKLKFIHSFHGSEVKHVFKNMKYNNKMYEEALIFRFPKKFFTYFKTTGLTLTCQRDYIISIYPEALNRDEYFTIMQEYHMRDVLERR